MVEIKRCTKPAFLISVLGIILLFAQTTGSAQAGPSAGKGRDWSIGGNGTIEWKHLTDASLNDKVRDITVSEDGDLVFALTRKEVVVFSAEEEKILDRIAINKPFDRIAFAPPDKLILASSKPARVETIRFRRIYDIDITGRHFKGPEDAEVTIVVFDDYQ